MNRRILTALVVAVALFAAGGAPASPFGPTSVSASTVLSLYIPGSYDTAGGANFNRVSATFNPTSNVVVNLTTGLSTGSLGVWCDTGSYNQALGSSAGTHTYTSISGKSRCFVYIWLGGAYSSSVTGAGTVTFDGAVHNDTIIATLDTPGITEYQSAACCGQLMNRLSPKFDPGTD